MVFGNSGTGRFYGLSGGGSSSSFSSCPFKHLQGAKSKQYFGQAPRGALERRAQDPFKDLHLDVGDEE